MIENSIGSPIQVRHYNLINFILLCLSRKLKTSWHYQMWTLLWKVAWTRPWRRVTLKVLPHDIRLFRPLTWCSLHLTGRHREREGVRCLLLVNSIPSCYLSKSWQWKFDPWILPLFALCYFRFRDHPTQYGWNPSEGKWWQHHTRACISARQVEHQPRGGTDGGVWSRLWSQTTTGKYYYSYNNHIVLIRRSDMYSLNCTLAWYYSLPYNSIGILPCTGNHYASFHLLKPRYLLLCKRFLWLPEIFFPLVKW